MALYFLFNKFCQLLGMVPQSEMLGNRNSQLLLEMQLVWIFSLYVYWYKFIFNFKYFSIIISCELCLKLLKSA